VYERPAPLNYLSLTGTIIIIIIIFNALHAKFDAKETCTGFLSGIIVKFVGSGMHMATFWRELN